LHCGAYQQHGLYGYAELAIPSLVAFCYFVYSLRDGQAVSGFFTPLPVRPWLVRPQACSHPGSFAPWLICPLALSPPGLFAPCAWLIRFLACSPSGSFTFWYSRKSRYFTVVGQSFVKTLFSRINIDDEMAADRLTVCEQELLLAFPRLVSISSHFLYH